MYEHKIEYSECVNLWERKKIKDLIGQQEYIGYIFKKLRLRPKNHQYIRDYYNEYIKRYKRMICKNCETEDLLQSDLIGDYCVHCFNYEEQEGQAEYNGKDTNGYTYSIKVGK